MDRWKICTVWWVSEVTAAVKWCYVITDDDCDYDDLPVTVTIWNHQCIYNATCLDAGSFCMLVVFEKCIHIYIVYYFQSAEFLAHTVILLSLLCNILKIISLHCMSYVICFVYQWPMDLGKLMSRITGITGMMRMSCFYVTKISTRLST